VPLALGGLALAGLPGAGVAAILSALVLLGGQAVPSVQWLSKDDGTATAGTLHPPYGKP